eukprot:69559_1
MQTLGILLSIFLYFVHADVYFPPEQIHISLGLTPDVITFNWLTMDDPIQTNSFVLIGESPQPSSFTYNVSGKATVFTDCGSEKIHRTIHVVTVNHLKASQRYYYQVGDLHTGYSAVYSFTTAPDQSTLSQSLPHKFILYGDMGTTNTQACGPATQMILNGDINAVIHIGDFAYNMYENNGTTGDQFMRDITAMAANTPYMVGMGNHEVYYNFSHYTQRFRGQPLPQYNAPQVVDTESGPCPNNWFYSFDYGLVHYVSISSEIYFTFPWLIPAQYEWLEKDLKAANANRSRTPWIVVYHHRPLYCTGTGSECGSQTFVMRNGVQVNGSSEYEYGLEDMYYKYGVDFVFTGHVHNYERVYDVYQNKTDQRTEDMTATTYVITGDAGNREKHHPFDQNSNPKWSAYRTTVYSFTTFMVYNATHIHFQQITADSEQPPSQQGAVLDDVWFVQNKHGPFGEREDIVSPEEPKKTITYDPYDVKKTITDGDVQIPFISGEKEDYKGMEGVYF